MVLEDPFRATKHCGNVELGNREIEGWVFQFRNFTITRLHNGKRQFQVSGIASLVFFVISHNTVCRYSPLTRVSPLILRGTFLTICKCDRVFFLSELGYSFQPLLRYHSIAEAASESRWQEVRMPQALRSVQQNLTVSHRIVHEMLWQSARHSRSRHRRQPRIRYRNAGSIVGRRGRDVTSE